jgi:hypothetical protein
MRKSLLSIVALGPLAILAGLALPAAAQSAGEPTVTQSPNPTIDLDAIPVKPVAGPLAIERIAMDDEEDGMPAGVEVGDREHRAGIGVDDDGASHEARHDDSD